MRRTLVLLALAAFVAVAGAADPAKTGRLAVGVTTVEAVDTARENRTLPTDVWYPARTAGRDATPLPKAYPLILMAHGFCGSRTNYEYLTTHLASYGYVVGAADFTGVTREACDAGQVTVSTEDLPLDLSFVCRTLHDTSGPLAKWAQHVRGIPTGLVGHSLGGKAVFDAALMDPSFTAIVGLAPAQTGDDAAPFASLVPRRAWMVMGGTADGLVSLVDFTTPFFEGLPPPAYLVAIDGGTHSGFTDVDSHLTPEALAQQQTFVRRYATAFFGKYLAKKNKFRKFLRPADAAAVSLRARPK